MFLEIFKSNSKNCFKKSKSFLPIFFYFFIYLIPLSTKYFRKFPKNSKNSKFLTHILIALKISSKPKGLRLWLLRTIFFKSFKILPAVQTKPNLYNISIFPRQKIQLAKKKKKSMKLMTCLE